VVNPVTVQTMTLHATSDAAGKVSKHVLIFVSNAAAHRHHVTGAPIFGIYRAQNVIEQSALFKLGIFDVWMNREKASRHLEHVIDVAAFIGAAVHALAQLIGRAKVFVSAM